MHRVKKKGEYQEDDGWEQILPAPGQAWYDVPLPPCPDCGGMMVWYEAGYVPGTRKCLGQPIGAEPDGRLRFHEDAGCGSMFSVGMTDDGSVRVRRERFY